MIKFQPKKRVDDETKKSGDIDKDTDEDDNNQHVSSYQERMRVNSMPSPSKSRERVVWNKINSLQLGYVCVEKGKTKSNQ